MAKSSKFKCPQCLSDVVVNAELAGTRVECPVCEATLTVPMSLGHDALFDDLFDDSLTDESNEDQQAAENDAGIRILADSGDEATVDESRSDTKHPVEVEFVDDAEADIDIVLPISDVVTAAKIHVIDDLGDKDLETEESTDPFAYDEDKAIHIEGVTDGLLAPGSFYLKCPVCDSHMKATEHQVGQKAKCSDCYSEIVVVKPEKKERKDAWRQAATIRNSDDDNELKLSEPVERPKVDYSISPEYGLNEVQQDLLAPVVEPELVSEGDQTAKKTENPIQPRQSKTTQPSRPKLARPQNDTKRKSTTDRTTKIDPEKTKPIELKQLLRFNFLGDIDLMLRTAVCVVFLALAYTMEESVWYTLQLEDLNGGEKFVRYFPALVGAFICFVLFCWFISVTFSVLMRSVANGNEQVDEWVGFAPSEWLGSFLIFAISAWVALLPGMLCGYIAMKVTGWFLFVPLFGSLSFCLLLPIVLTSAFVNESVYNVFSQDVFQSLAKDGDSWTAAYQLFAIPAAIFVLGSLIVFLPGLFFSMIGAILQVAGITIYAILIGLQARVVIGRMARS